MKIADDFYDISVAIDEWFIRVGIRMKMFNHRFQEASNSFYQIMAKKHKEGSCCACCPLHGQCCDCCWCNTNHITLWMN